MELAGTLASLIADRQQLSTVVLGFEAIIELSFAQDGATMTRDEVKRRFRICEKIFKELRGDLGWGVRRILDNLPEYLRCELDGRTWEPDKRQCWITSDGA